jgi:hypothetical protein
MTSDIFLSEVACTPGLTASHMVQSSSENDSILAGLFLAI